MPIFNMHYLTLLTLDLIHFASQCIDGSNIMLTSPKGAHESCKTHSAS